MVARAARDRAPPLSVQARQQQASTPHPPRSGRATLVEILPFCIILLVDVVPIVFEVLLVAVRLVLFVVVFVIFLDRFELDGGGTGYFEVGSAVGAAD